MNEFLAETRNVYQNILLNPTYYNRLRIVLSNESCDLDSAISSLVYGFILHHEGIEENHYKTAVLPLLNVHHDDLVLKTEVIYFLKTSGILLENVPTRGFRDLLDLKKIHDAGVLEVTLLDHHNMCSEDEYLKSSVVEVIDHRPQDPNWLWKDISNVTIESVNSCCSLIANKIRERCPHLMTQEISKLLLGPILVDTRNLTSTTTLDMDMANYLMSIVSVDQQDLYESLIQAKTDIGNLTTSQVLRKDLKIVGGVPIASVPLLINELKNRKDFEQAVEDFMKLKNNVPVVVLMGLDVTGGQTRRDIAVYGRDSFINCILDPLKSSINPSLDLDEIIDHGLPQLRLFSRGNLSATRKQIAPIVFNAALANEEIIKCGLG